MPDNDGKLDAKEVAELLKEWQKEIKEANGKVETAIKSLEGIRTEIVKATEELKEARTISEKSILYPIKKAAIKHPKFSLSIFLIVTALLVGGLVCIFKDKDWSYKDKERQVETKTNKIINQP